MCDVVDGDDVLVLSASACVCVRLFTRDVVCVNFINDTYTETVRLREKSAETAAVRKGGREQASDGAR